MLYNIVSRFAFHKDKSNIYVVDLDVAICLYFRPATACPIALGSVSSGCWVTDWAVTSWTIRAAAATFSVTR